MKTTFIEKFGAAPRRAVPNGVIERCTGWLLWQALYQMCSRVCFSVIFGPKIMSLIEL
jgi:hypothetical protein